MSSRNLTTALLTALALTGNGAAKTPEEMDQARIAAVVQFAKTVLKHGRDRYGEKHTPLFTDTLDVVTMDAPERMYIFRLNKPGPRQWQPWQPVVSSNLAYQGTLNGLRLEVDVLPEHSAGVLEWRVR